MIYGVIQFRIFLANFFRKMRLILSIPSTILILSANSDFAETLAVLASREFAAICKIINSESEIQGKNWNLLITDRAFSGDLPFPIIVVNLPVRLRNLFAEMAAALKNSKENDIIPIGKNLQLFLQSKSLNQIKTNLSIDLTDKEIQLLQAVNGAGEAGISREDLLKKVWDIDENLDTHTLETHIYRLRKKIRDIFGLEMIKIVDGVYTAPK